MPIRTLEESDTAAYRVLRLQALSEWPPAFGSLAQDEAQRTELDMRQQLRPTTNQRFHGAVVASKLVGIARLSRYTASNEGHRAALGGLYVDPDHRRQGLGRLLVDACIAVARDEFRVRRLNLTVVSDQTAAISLYTSLGFEECGIDREAFSARGEYFDELLMTMPLRGPIPSMP